MLKINVRVSVNWSFWSVSHQEQHFKHLPVAASTVAFLYLDSFTSDLILTAWILVTFHHLGGFWEILKSKSLLFYFRTNQHLPHVMEYMHYILLRSVISVAGNNPFTFISFNHPSRSASAALCDRTKLPVTDVAGDLVIKLVELMCWGEQDSWFSCIWWMNYPPRQLSRATDCFSAAELVNSLCSWNVGTVRDKVLTRGNSADIYGIHTCMVWYSVIWCSGQNRVTSMFISRSNEAAGSTGRV